VIMPSIAPLDVDPTELGHVEQAGFLEDSPVFAGVTGRVALLGERLSMVDAHAGLLVAAISHDGKFHVSGGEDGLVRRIDAAGKVETLAEQKGWWIDKVACGPSGAVAFGSARKGIVVGGDGQSRSFECERAIEGLAFAPKGMRLAVARYNGVDLNWINTPAAPQFLEWKGAHTGVVFSPDGKYVVSMMQENALHGWRLSDNKHMRMSGYPAKVKSLSFSSKGKWLASSGAPAAIVWPFSGKDGPMGKAPKELGAMGNNLVTCVACHPTEEVVSIGYGDGMVLAVRIEDGKEAMLKRPGIGAISTLGWDSSGTRIAYGSEAGEAGIIDIT
jgi:WD40 repeat protein